MGFLRTPVDYLALSLIVSAVCVQGAAACLDGWSLFEGSCYLAMGHAEWSSAIQTCGNLGGQLPKLSPNNSAFRLLSHLEERGVSSLWLPYRLLRQNDSGSVVVVDEKNKTTKNCQECNRLTSNLSESCITVGKTGWTVVICNDTSQYACQMDRRQEAGTMQAAEIAAIICGIFLIICIVVVFTLDIIKNPGKDDEIALAGE